MKSENISIIASHPIVRAFTLELIKTVKERRIEEYRQKMTIDADLVPKVRSERISSILEPRPKPPIRERIRIPFLFRKKNAPTRLPSKPKPNPTRIAPVLISTSSINRPPKAELSNFLYREDFPLPPEREEAINLGEIPEMPQEEFVPQESLLSQNIQTNNFPVHNLRATQPEEIYLRPMNMMESMPLNDPGADVIPEVTTENINNFNINMPPQEFESLNETISDFNIPVAEPKPIEPRPIDTHAQFREAPPKVFPQRLEVNADIPVAEPKPIQPKPIEPMPIEPKPIQPKPIQPKPIIHKPLERQSPKRMIKPKIEPKIKPVKEVIPAPPQIVNEPTEVPKREEGDYGKIMTFVNDPSVHVIECSGANKPMKVVKAGQRQITKASLTEEEIRSLLEQISEEVHIPLLEGVFRAAVSNFTISAIVSPMIGSKFIIKKQTPLMIIRD
jgi:hypothetical protein